MAIDKRMPEFVAGLVGCTPTQFAEMIKANEDLVAVALALDEDLEADEAALFARLAVCAKAYRKIAAEIGRKPEIWAAPRQDRGGRAEPTTEAIVMMGPPQEPEDLEP